VDGRGIILWVAAGILIGGTWSFYKHKVPTYGTIFVGIMAALETAGAIQWSV
jgi:hypothetical protein